MSVDHGPMLTQPNYVDLLLKDITSVLKRTAGSRTAMWFTITHQMAAMCVSFVLFGQLLMGHRWQVLYTVHLGKDGICHYIK